MKRRNFLKLLGLTAAMPVVAKAVPVEKHSCGYEVSQRLKEKNIAFSKGEVKGFTIHEDRATAITRGVNGTIPKRDDFMTATEVDERWTEFGALNRADFIRVFEKHQIKI